MQKEQIVLCFHCGNKTLMKCVSDFNIHLTSEIEFIHKFWELYLCPICNETTLIYTNKIWYTWEEPEFASISIKNVYPGTTQETSQMPTIVKNAFEAAMKVRNIDGAICALSLRRTLEMMCKDQGETDGDLYKKLENLSRRNIMPPLLTDMATILRKLGNTAAHADDAEFPLEVVNSMIEFTQVILDYVYVLPDKLASIQKNLSKEVVSTESVTVEVDEVVVISKSE